MKKHILSIIAFIICIPFITKSQTLGGYALYDCLATAVHPDGCDPTYVTAFPDDSIWVNFGVDDTMTGEFNLADVDSNGFDLLLETGFHESNYGVSLLLSNGTYSSKHDVTVADWTNIGFVNWKYIFATCGTGVQNDDKFVVGLDYSLHFGLTASDTVIGIQIVFYSSPGATDLAGAYYISHSPVGINDAEAGAGVALYPNPFTDKLNITLNSNEVSEIILYDISSRKLLQREFVTSVTLDTKELLKGIYFYEVRSRDKVVKKGKVIHL